MAKEKKIPTRPVRVKFFRAVEASAESPGWSWPPDGEVGAALKARFEARRAGGGERWQIIRYWGRLFHIEMHEYGAGLQFSVSDVRSDDLPLILAAGATEGTPMDLAVDDRLLEPSYMTFFGDQLVGFVRGDKAPGHRMASAALARLTQLNLDLVPVPRANILALVQRADEVTTVDITLAAGSLDAAAENIDLVRAAASAATRVAAAEKVKLSVTAETATQKRGLKGTVENLLQNRGLGGIDSAHARVMGEEVASELVNLFESDMATSVRVPVDARTRHLPPESAHSAAVTAYAELAESLSNSIVLADDSLSDPPKNRRDGAEVDDAEDERPGPPGEVELEG